MVTLLRFKEVGNGILKKKGVDTNLESPTSASDSGCHLGNKGCQLGNDVTPGHTESSGVPTKWNISYIWQICNRQIKIKEATQGQKK